MVYLIEPKEALGDKRCIGVAYPLYGIPPCHQVCPSQCLLIPCPTLG
jgi:hypothetical protein